MTTIISGSSPSITFSDSTTQTTAFTTPVSIANGGTGLTSFTTNGVPYATSTSALTTNSGLTYNGTTLTTGSVTVNSATAPLNGMYYRSTAISGLSFYNTGASGSGSSTIQTYYGRSSLATTTNGAANNEQQWYGFSSNPQITTIGSTASIYNFAGHGYLISDVPFGFTFNGGSRGDNTDYNCPAANGIIYVNMSGDYGGNASNGHNGIYVKNAQQGLGGGDTSGIKVVSNAYSTARNFHSLSQPTDPNGGGISPRGFFAQIDTSAGIYDNSAPVGLLIDNALVDNYTKRNGGAPLAVLYDRRSGSGTEFLFTFYRNTTSNQVGSISATNTTTSYNTSSDYRLKENVKPLIGALEKITRLKPCTFTWKKDGSIGEGFIAHELQEVIPQAVSGEKDEEKLQSIEIEHAISEIKDVEGNIIQHQKPPVYEEQMTPLYQGVDTSFLVATLTAAIQEQQVLIDALNNRISLIENKTV